MKYFLMCMDLVVSKADRLFAHRLAKGTPYTKMHTLTVFIEFYIILLLFVFVCTMFMQRMSSPQVP